MYPSKASVVWKLSRTLMLVLFLTVVAAAAMFLVLKLSALPFITMVLSYVMPVFWVLLVSYLLMWIGVYFSYKDYKWASRLCEAKESYDLERYRKAVDYASFALNYKKKCGLSFLLRGKAYEHLDNGSLPRTDMDMAVSLGINPDDFDF